MNTVKTTSFLKLTLEFLILTILAIAVPSLVMFDFLVLENNLSESSLTEILQELILFSISAFLLYRARKAPEVRGALLLATGFFTTMFIREFDYLFDRTPVSWVWPVLVVIVASLVAAFKEKQKNYYKFVAFQ